MGIRPLNGAPLDPPSSTPQERYGDMVTELEKDGDEAGKAISEIYAEATSANNGAAELAADLTALEAVSTASGTGWQAYKRGKTVTLAINGIQAGFTLPAGYRPAIPIYAALIDESGQTMTRMHIPVNGLVILYDSPPAPVYGHATFITT